jgi:RNA polymerase sigma factor (sigma-70 family)
MELAKGVFEKDVCAAMAGDAAAFTRLVNETKQLVTSIVVAKLHRTEGSEDIAQDIYVGAWKGIRGLKNPKSFLPWLKQLSRNQIHSAIRKEQKTRSRFVTGLDDVLPTATHENSTPYHDAVENEEHRIVQACFETLGDDAREILTLYYREGQSISQVSALLELREATVKKRLERARKAIRKDVLVKLGETLQKSAPSKAFAAAVMGSIAMGTKSAAASTLGGMASKPSASIASTHAGALLGPALAGMAMGIFGVFVYFNGFGTLQGFQRKDGQLRRLALMSCGSVFLVVLGILGAAYLKSPAMLVSAWIAGIPLSGLLVGSATVVYAASQMQ